MFIQFRVPPLTIWRIQQQFTLIVAILYTASAYTNNNCPIDLYNKDLQTTIILFTCNMSSHRTDWILSELPLLAMSCLVYCLVSRLMNAFKGECLCLCETPININKLFIVILVCCLHCPWSVVVVRLLVYPLFLHCTLLLPVYFFISFLY